MRFFNLLVDVGVGVGTLLSSYCPEDGIAPTSKPPVVIDKACTAWGKTVDAAFNPVGLAFLGIKDGSFNMGWDGVLIGKWRGGHIAILDDDMSPDVSFVNGTTNSDIDILDTGGTPDPGAPTSTARTLDVNTGTKDIKPAPCIICSSLREAPTATVDRQATMVAADLEAEYKTVPLVDPESVEVDSPPTEAEKLIALFYAFTIPFWTVFIWLKIDTKRRALIDDFTTSVARRCADWFAVCITAILRPIRNALAYFGPFAKIMNGLTIPWDSNGKVFVTTKHGKWMSLAVLSSSEYVLVEGSPDDEEPEPELAEAEEAGPARRISTSGARDSRRGQKKAKKNVKANAKAKAKGWA
ncbi:hypothetical protein EVJ58_g7798 [Rhodofomes roseus]|uniref:Uncharacterized protein n=1 Tax=Rhodofomes roseus TaxID=34475 RepID=A0A4Y9Y3L7_9APHY|nr:hypothetical protein EVJ58_g7798 [Rhodofomes roseus]